MSTTSTGYGEVPRFKRIALHGGAEIFEARFGRFEFARHAHGRVSIGLITRGVQRIDQAGGSELAGAGTLLLCNHDKVHWGGSLRAKGESEGWDTRMIGVSPEALHALAREQGLRLRGTLGFPRMTLLHEGEAAAFTRMHRAFEAGLPRLEAESLFNHVVGGILRRHGDALMRPDPGLSENRAVVRARDYLEAHVGDNVSLAELAAESGLSQSRLIRTFKAATGLPPHAYHAWLRVRRAQQLLRKGQPVAEVAADCGFVDQAHLTRAFRRYHVEVPPGRFRSG